jgi:ADP-ribosylglycohydrolase
MMSPPSAPHSAIVGAILGTAVGDALGLPYEGLSRRRGVRLLGEPDRHHFFFGRGMVSDDTEHTCMVAQALIASGAEVDAFARRLAWGFRRWLLGVPAGIGWATLRATLKLWCGFGPRTSGVFSAGNGPAMRSAALGAAVDDLSRLRVLVEVVTRITHSDPKAEYGALAVALAARHARTHADPDGNGYLEELRSSLPQGATVEFLPLMEAAVRSAAAGESTPAFTGARGWRRGVSGYVYRTVPAAVHAWLRRPRDFRAGVADVIRCGGDTDTTAAIVGGIIGSGVGKAGIPPDWLATLFEWPRTVAWMEQLGERLGRTLAAGKPDRPPRLSAPALIARNQAFLLIVMAHIFRRCLPPY